MQRIFISSTFKDFQRERDLIRNVVEPRLNSYISSYGSYVSFIDLRWGIDTSETGEEDREKKILSVCLNTIDTCEPFMIVLLGDRPGYYPGKEAIRNELNKRNLQLEDYDISTTQLEIEYGAFLNEAQSKNIYFYIREDSANTDVEDDKLSLLKERIKSKYPDQVRVYHTDLKDEYLYNNYLELLQQDMVSDLTNALSLYVAQEYTETEYQKEMQFHLQYMEDKAAFFTSFQNTADTVKKFLEGNKVQKIALTGEIGSGKSTLFSKIVQWYLQKGNFVIPVFSGTTEKTMDADGILNLFLNVLEESLHEEHVSFEEQRENYLWNDRAAQTIYHKRKRLNELCEKMLSTRKNILIAVDAVDVLQADHLRDAFMFLPDSMDNVKILVTSSDSELVRYDFNIVQMPVPTQQEKEAIILRTLHLSAKQVPAQILKAIIDKKETDNPLFLYLLLQRISLLQDQDYKAIYQYEDTSQAIYQMIMTSIETAPDDLYSLSYELLSSIAEKTNLSIMEMAKYIAISRYGIRSGDYKKICELVSGNYQEVDVICFTHYFHEMFLFRGDGRVDFFHQCIRKAVLSNIKDDVPYHNNILHALLSYKQDDILRVKELQYHMLGSRKTRMFVQYISSLMDKQTEAMIRYHASDLRRIIFQKGEVWLEKLLCLLDKPTDYENYPDAEALPGKLVALDDYLNLLTYFGLYVAGDGDNTAEQLKYSRDLLENCIERFENIISNGADDNLDCLQKYSLILSNYAIVLNELKDEPDNEKAVTYALKACEQLIKHDYLVGESDSLKYTGMLLVAVTCMAESTDDSCLEEATTMCGAIIESIINNAQEKGYFVIGEVILIIRAFITQGTAYLNRGVEAYNEEAKESFSKGLEFIQEYDEKVIEQYLSGYRKSLVILLSKTQQDDLDKLREIVSERKLQYDIRKTTESEMELAEAYQALFNVLLKKDESYLKEAYDIAEKYIPLMEHLYEKRGTSISIYELSAAYVSMGTFYQNILKVVGEDDFICMSQAMTNFLKANSILESISEAERDIVYYQTKFNVIRFLYKLLIKYPEQNSLTIIYIIEGLEIADRLLTISDSYDSRMIYWESRVKKLLWDLSFADYESGQALFSEFENIEQGLEQLMLEKDVAQTRKFLRETYVYHAVALKTIRNQTSDSWNSFIVKALNIAETEKEKGDIFRLMEEYELF